MPGSRLALPVALLVALVACGGGNSPSNPTPNPGPSPTPTPQVDPCAAASSGEQAEPLAGPVSPGSKGLPRVDDDPRWNVLDSLWQHAASAGRLLLPLTTIGRNDQDQGDIAVIQDQGDVVVSANAFDLAAINLRFARNGSAYGVSRTDQRVPAASCQSAVALTVRATSGSRFTSPK